MKKIAFFPGSFDPFTLGHYDVVIRGLRVFDEVIIGMGVNNAKSRYFSPEKMKTYIEKTFDGLPVSVIIYNELTAMISDRMGARYLLRGLRNTTDFEYENSISQVNRYVSNDVLETVFLITSPQYAAINSSIIRELHRYGADIQEFIPYEID